MALTERFEALEQQGWRYIYDGRGFFSGIWRNEALDCWLNECGGSFQTITSAVQAAERFISALAECTR